MVIIFKIDSLNSIHICICTYVCVCVYNSVLLTIVAMLSIESPRICLLVGSLCPLTWHLSIFPTPEPLITILLSVRISAVLDSSCEWEHTVFIFFRPIPFTWRDALKVLLCGHRSQDLLLLVAGLLARALCAQSSVYPLSDGHRLLLPLDSCE